LTILIMTVAMRGDAAWISQDSATWGEDGARTGHVQKAACIPGRFIYGVTGNALQSDLFVYEGAMKAENVDALAGLLPAHFSMLPASIRKEGFNVFFAGWSPQHNRIVGYCASYASEMASELLRHGHMMLPEADDRFVGNEHLAGHALHGEHVEAMHEAVAEHMMVLQGGGGYSYTRLGGVLHTMRVDRAGITMRELRDLDAHHQRPVSECVQRLLTKITTIRPTAPSNPQQQQGA